MSQFNLFDSPEFLNILSTDGQVDYLAHLFSRNESDSFFESLKSEIAWSQDEITLYGKTHPIPRLQAWYGEPHTTYSYSSLTLHPLPFTDTLLALKESVEKATGHQFNCMLANLYRNGKDYTAWHSDDEKELGENPVIASLSFGAERKFRLCHKFNKGLEQIDVNLQHGSLLIMKGRTQHFWKHQLVKTAKPCHERINLTFRLIR